MLKPAPRPPRQSFFEGPSTVFCVAVTACTVVMRPSFRPKVSLITCDESKAEKQRHDIYGGRQKRDERVKNGRRKKGGLTCCQKKFKC